MALATRFSVDLVRVERCYCSSDPIDKRFFPHSILTFQAMEIPRKNALISARILLEMADKALAENAEKDGDRSGALTL